MTNSLRTSDGPTPWRGQTLLGLSMALACLALAGCQAMTNPVLDGIPVRRLPPEYLGRSRESLRPLPLSLLRQPRIETYTVDTGDVLGIYIDPIIGPKGGVPPVNAPEPGQLPSIGLPFAVQPDGTLVLPLLKEPLFVRGKTLQQIQDLLDKAYRGGGVVAGAQAPMVSLYRRRMYHVLVVRQDSGANSTNASGSGGVLGVGAVGQAVGISGKGTGFALDLPAGENDVMNALTRSGGLPGFDAADEVIIERGSFKPGDSTGDAASRVEQVYGDYGYSSYPSEYGGRVTRIPLRLPAGQRPQFNPKDVILGDGDIVFIASRTAEVFYVGGLLFTGQYQLPRDYDLGVVEAIAVTRGSMVNGGTVSLNNFSGGSGGIGGIGTPNPSAISILRRLPNGQQVTIYVDYNRALRDPREDIIIQPKDIIILQFTPGEALVRYFTTVLRFDLVGTFIRQQDLIGTSTLNVP